MPTPFIIVWRYRVADAQRAAFEAAYGRDGVWSRLFGRSPHFLGTELFIGDGGAYLTIDRWESETDADSFLASCRDEYDRIDRLCGELTETEQLLFRGRFVS